MKLDIDIPHQNISYYENEPINIEYSTMCIHVKNIMINALHKFLYTKKIDIFCNYATILC